MTMHQTHQTDHPHVRPPGPSFPRRWPALALLSVAQFMLILDVTVVNVALPDIGADLGLGRAALTWVVTAYTLCFGGLMLLGGRLADLAGPRRIVLAGLALFTAASLISGLSTSAAMLIAGRVAQGIGAALLSPAALAAVTRMFHGAERAKALGVWAALGGTGAAAGVLVGGALTSGPGWQWIFFINVPVGAAVLLALPGLLVNLPGSGRQSLDVLGALLVAGSTAALIYALIGAGDKGWLAGSTLLWVTVAIAGYALFTLVERRRATPLVDLRLLTRRPVVTGAYLMVVATGLLIAAFFLGSFLLQHQRGHSALATGLLFLPVAIGTGIGAHLASRAVAHAGGRSLAAAGLALAAIGLSLAAPVGPTPLLIIGLSLSAAGLGATFVAATTTALGLIRPEEAGVASGIINTFHEIGGAVGVAVVSSIAAASLAGGPTSGFTTAFTVTAVAAVVAAAVTLAIAPREKPLVSDIPYAH